MDFQKAYILLMVVAEASKYPQLKPITIAAMEQLTVMATPVPSNTTTKRPDQPTSGPAPTSLMGVKR